MQVGPPTKYKCRIFYKAYAMQASTQGGARSDVL